jgi:hypothetical protein
VILIKSIVEVKYFDNLSNQQQIEETYFDNLSKEEPVETIHICNLFVNVTIQTNTNLTTNHLIESKPNNNFTKP